MAGLKDSGMGKGRPEIRRGGDDGNEDGHLPSVESVPHTQSQSIVMPLLREQFVHGHCPIGDGGLGIGDLAATEDRWRVGVC